MAKKIIRVNTWVTNPDGQREELIPGQELPDWAKDQVTNPRVFGEKPSGVGQGSGLVRGGGQAADTGDGDGDDPDFGDDGKTGEPDYEGMIVSELDELLEERELSLEGRKAEKIQRLKDHDAAVG